MNELPVMLITGTSKGLGEGMAKHFLAHGYKVFGCSRSTSNISHRNYSHTQVDVTKEDELCNWVKSIYAETNHIDVLINNAGIASMNHLLTTPADTLRRLYEVNAVAPFILIREVAKTMIKQGGKIINLTTVAVPLNLEGELAYTMSKSALEQLTKTAAKELAPFKITVNAIGPGPVATDLVGNVPTDKMSQLLKTLQIKELQTVQQVIHAVEIFLTKKEDSTTGQVVYLGSIS